MSAPGGGAPTGPGSRLRENSALCLVPKANTLWAVTRSSRKGWLLPVSSRKAGPKCRRLCGGRASSEGPAGLSGSRWVGTPPCKPRLTRSARTGPLRLWARPVSFPSSSFWKELGPDTGYDGHSLLPGGWEERATPSAARGVPGCCCGGSGPSRWSRTPPRAHVRIKGWDKEMAAPPPSGCCLGMSGRSGKRRRSVFQKV